MLMRKIKSNTGASLSFALLLFLVCAVVGAAVLAAATAAAGRVAGLSAQDRRYYSVTSAAELLKDTLDRKAVTVERIRTETKQITVTETESGTTESSGAPTYDYAYRIDGETVTAVSAQDLLQKLAVYYVFGAASVPTGDARENNWNKTAGDDFAAGTESYTYPSDPSAPLVLKLSENGENIDDLNVNVKVTLQPDGLTKITLTSIPAEGEPAAGNYVLTLIYELDVRNSQTEKAEVKTLSHTTGGQEIRQTTTTTDKTSELTWIFQEMVKGEQ